MSNGVNEIIVREEKRGRELKRGRKEGREKRERSISIYKTHTH